MSSPKPWYLLLALCCIASGPLAFAQATSAPAQSTQAADENEVQQLRREIAELRAELRKLEASQAKGGTAAPPPAPPPAPPAAPPTQNAASQAEVDSLQQQVQALQAKASQPPPPPPPATAGWNGEHFFLRSTDGNFLLMPTGYLIGQYAVYGNQFGAPPDSFAIRTARFGFEGSYGKQLEYVFTAEAASSTATVLRDAYLDIKPWTPLRLMLGQFKVPFSIEVGTADTAVDFATRSIVTVLYPDAGGSFRAPGLDAHGQLVDGSIEYWVGVFNGQGLLASGTTNEPEVVGRVRVSPWKNADNVWLSGIGLGGSYEHSRSKGLAGEQSFSGLMNDNTYTFFPQFHINGNVNRYNGFLSWLTGPLGVRAEYTHLQMDREDIGSLTPGGIAFLSQPAVVGEGYYVSAIYFLTGETEAFNALPRVRHPVLGPASPGESGAPGWGAWAVKVRYARLSGNAPGSTCDESTVPTCPITPVISPGFNDTTDQISFGFNWYLNYWVVLKTDVNVDRLKDPSVQGILPRDYWVFLETLQFRF
jgi:phosphate-selective porin